MRISIELYPSVVLALVGMVMLALWARRWSSIPPPTNFFPKSYLSDESAQSSQEKTPSRSEGPKVLRLLLACAKAWASGQRS